jgi:hypothetical protein
LGNDYLERFLALHPHSSPRACELYLSNDGHDDADWEQEGFGWQEDILSRRFWDSYHQKTIRCAACHKTLSDDWTRPPRENVMRLSRGLYVCHAECRDRYLHMPHPDRHHPIYDSSSDKTGIEPDKILLVGCTQCKEFAAVDGLMEADGTVRDFQYLAEFMSEHVGHRSLKVFFK